MTIDCTVYIVDRIVRVPGKAANWSLHSEDWMLTCTESFKEFVRMSRDPRNFQSRQFALDVVSLRSMNDRFAGLIFPAAKQAKRGLTWSVECVGSHGCGIVSRQTSQAFAFTSYKNHLLTNHAPAFILIKEDACH